jgi:DNA polymerase-3 subunit delta'
MKFSEIPGLADVKQKLFRTVENEKVAHAQLFAGSEGSANLALAIAYATVLNCTSRTNDDACGECPSCIKISKYIHPDLHFVFPVSSTKKITGKEVISDSFIGEWRAFLKPNAFRGAEEWSQEFGGEDKQLNISREESRQILKKLSLKSFEGAYKVMIIWLAEYMHPSAANALLKLLEEPPERTVFLLVTNDHEKIIGTILSRVQLLKIRPFNKTEIADYLVSHYNVAEEKASQIAGISSGDLNHAVKLISEVEDGTHEMFRQWMRICFQNDYARMVAWADDFFKSSKLSQKGLFQYGLAMVRDSLLQAMGTPNLVHANEKEQEFITNFAGTMNLQKLQNLYQQLNSGIYHLERNGNVKIIFLETSLQISSIFNRQA